MRIEAVGDGYDGYFHSGSGENKRKMCLQLDFMTARVAEFEISSNNSEWTEFTPLRWFQTANT
ncbi:hypothetical protein SUGI_1082570 [Cryptomeria japonica]|nr:hypothetical protein SUGI_1082570 [Cryptomeria japonica]